MFYSEEYHDDEEHQCWHPYPQELAHDNIPSPTAEEAVDPDGRDHERPPGKKIACVVEGREERNAVSAGGHGIEQAVGGRDREEVSGQRPPLAGKSRNRPERQQDHQQADNEREGQRVEESPVAEHMAVGNAKTKDNDIEVREQRAEQAQRQKSQRHPPRRNGIAEGGSDKYMGERRGHKRTKRLRKRTYERSANIGEKTYA